MRWRPRKDRGKIEPLHVRTTALPGSRPYPPIIEPAMWPVSPQSVYLHQHVKHIPPRAKRLLRRRFARKTPQMKSILRRSPFGLRPIERSFSFRGVGDCPAFRRAFIVGCVHSLRFAVGTRRCLRWFEPVPFHCKGVGCRVRSRDCRKNVEPAAKG